MSVVAAICLGALCLAALLVLLRLALGPTVPDRIVALDTLLQLVLMGIAIGAALSGDGSFLAVLVAVSLLGFVGSVTVARYVERRGS